MSSPLRIGLIGLDTSHAVAFTGLLNDPDAEHHIPGGKVVAAYPGGTADWPLSSSRVEGYTQQLRDDFGVAIESNPKQVAESTDLLLITAADGREHRKLLEQVAPLGRPTFVDKPFATSTADAEAMLQLADEHGFPLMSCSALRYAEVFTAALKDDTQGAVGGIDVFGPMILEPALPGLFWYGCHSVEMIVAAMGPGCREVRVSTTETTDTFSMIWDDGRVATLRGTRDGHLLFGLTLHRETGFQQVDIQAGQTPFYADMLKAILTSLPVGHSAVPHREMLEAVRIMEAGNRAREADTAITLEPLQPVSVTK